MSVRNEALINPSILAWARESAGFYLEEAAHKIKVSSDVLEACELGEKRLSISQLRLLSNAYKRPLAFFYLPVAPEKEDIPKDFRRLDAKAKKTLSPKLRLEIRKAEYRREVALELYKELDFEIPTFNLKISISSDVIEVSQPIRKLLNVDLDEQKKLQGEYAVLNFWRERFEKMGILVFQAPMIQLNQMRGFSIDDFPLPIIVLNSKDYPKARVFTLFHELAHLLLRSGGICDLGEQNKVEVFCNAVAGETLVPTNPFVKNPIVQNNRKESDWNDEKIFKVSEQFNVSREVILRRLLTIGKISENFYRQKREKYLSDYKNKNKMEGETEKKSIRLPQHTKIISQSGKSFVRLVLESHRQNKIGLLDVSEYLGTKIKHIPKIEQAISNSTQMLGGSD